MWKIKKGMAIMQERVFYGEGEIITKIEPELEIYCDRLEKEIPVKIAEPIAEIPEEIPEEIKKAGRPKKS